MVIVEPWPGSARVVGNAESLARSRTRWLRAARIPVFTKPASWRDATCPRCAVRRPRRGRPVAPRRGPAPYGGPPPPTCSPTSTRPARRRRLRLLAELAGLPHRRPVTRFAPLATACGRLTVRCRCAVGTSRAPATGGALHRRVARPSSTDPQRVGDLWHRRGSDLPMNTLDALDAASRPTTFPTPPRDTLTVHVRVVEGNGPGAVFQGVAIRRQGSGVRENVHRAQDQLWRRRRADVPAHTPIIERIEVVTRGDVPGPSSTTCATCAARPPRSRRSARPRPLAVSESRTAEVAPAGSCPGASYDVVPSGSGRPAPARGAGRGDPRQDICRAGLMYPVRVDAADPAGR